MTLYLKTVLGTDTIGSTSVGFTADRIFGSVSTCTDTGRVQSIRAALKYNVTGSTNAKAAIYKHSDLSLVGYTEDTPIALTTTYQWFTFKFTTLPIVEAGTEYIPVVYFNRVDINYSVSASAGAVNEMHNQSKAYDGFPDPLVPSHNDYTCSIYAVVAYSGVYDQIKKQVENTPTPISHILLDGDVPVLLDGDRECRLDVYMNQFRKMIERVKKWR